MKIRQVLQQHPIVRMRGYHGFELRHVVLQRGRQSGGLKLFDLLTQSFGLTLIVHLRVERRVAATCEHLHRGVATGEIVAATEWRL